MWTWFHVRRINVKLIAFFRSRMWSSSKTDRRAADHKVATSDTCMGFENVKV